MPGSKKVPKPDVPAGEALVSGEQLGVVLGGIDIRSIQRHAKEGIIIKAGHGQYYLFRSIAAYCKHQRATLARHQSKDGSIDAVAESALLKRANRETVELKRAQLEGRLISLPELEETWVMVMKSIRSMILAVPGRVGFSRPHMTKDDLRAIQQECEEVLKLNSLSNPKRGPLPEPPND